MLPDVTEAHSGLQHYQRLGLLGKIFLSSRHSMPIHISRTHKEPLRYRDYWAKKKSMRVIPHTPIDKKEGGPKPSRFRSCCRSKRGLHFHSRNPIAPTMPIG